MLAKIPKRRAGAAFLAQFPPVRIRRAVAECGNISFLMEELPNGFLVTFTKIPTAQNSEIGEKIAAGGVTAV